MSSDGPHPTAKPWLGQYPSQLPFELEPRFTDMLSMFAATVAAVPQGEAVRYFDGVLSWSDLDALSDAFAVWLAERGVRRGDRVSVILQNTPHGIIAILAAWKLGAVPVPGNPMYRTAELARLFADYSPAVVVCQDSHVAEVHEGLVQAGLADRPLVSVDPHDFQSLDDARLLPDSVVSADDRARPFSDILAAFAGQTPPPVALSGEDLGLILYTSGTTGVPKGAMIRHASLAFNSETAAVWLGLDHTSRILALAPVFHITGFVLHVCAAIAARASLGLHYRVQPDAVLDFIRVYRPTFTIAAVTAFNALMGTPSAGPTDFSSFRSVFTGGAPVPPALRDAVRDALGIVLLPVYGMTETCSPTHISPIGVETAVDRDSGVLSVGLPISSTEARIVDAGGVPLPAGQTGEIQMRGPQIMAGYWNRPVETQETLVDGWMRSGDIGFMDANGWFYVIDRQKDVIIASGFKVWPREVEDALYEHPAVAEAAVIGVPDPYRGETVKAFVSLRPGAERPAQAELIAHCRARLAAYKAPRSVVILDRLPQTPTGKIQRAALRGQDKIV